MPARTPRPTTTILATDEDGRRHMLRVLPGARVATRPMEGLGADMGLFKRICADDPEVVELLKDATTGEHGGDRQSGTFKIRNTNLESGGTDDAGYALHRLRKDRPDLHARVIAKELSPHRAMIEAGFRPRTITCPVEPERAARLLRKHFVGDLESRIRDIGGGGLRWRAPAARRAIAAGPGPRDLAR